jgi:hypothetical protein
VAKPRTKQAGEIDGLHLIAEWARL